MPEAGDAADLITRLQTEGYDPITFPGCFESADEYLKWLETGGRKGVSDTCEGFGLVLRLGSYRTDVLEQLDAYFRSEHLQAALMEKFGVAGTVTSDAGIQKYLSGYEISPHPDIRKKALTWMLNVNPGASSEDDTYHTHYMRFRPEYAYVQTFWEHNHDVDRCWVPWDWCETVKRQTANNSIVFFAPSDDTLHAVKANYDHLKIQRTQFYGNLWFTADPDPKKATHEDLDIAGRIRVPLRKRVRHTLMKLKETVGV